MRYMRHLIIFIRECFLVSKINNSAPCFCGSGKAFKSCCKGKIHSNKSLYGEDVLNNPNRINHIIQ